MTSTFQSSSYMETLSFGLLDHHTLLVFNVFLWSKIPSLFSIYILIKTLKYYSNERLCLGWFNQSHGSKYIYMAWLVWLSG